MTLPTVEEITKYFLFGSLDIPTDFLSSSMIRPPVSPANKVQVGIDKYDFMTVGGGRFATGAQFEIIRDFFDNTIPVGIYTKAQLAAELGYGSNPYYGWTMNQSDWQDEYNARKSIKIKTFYFSS